MVCKEEVCLWFKNSEPHRRLELLCCLFHMCLPFELHFMKTFLEDLSKRVDLQEDVKKFNNHQEIESLSNILDDQTRSKLVVCVALLTATNHAGSEILFRILSSQSPHSSLQMSSNYQKEMLLLYTLALHHPAFNIQHKNCISELLVSSQPIIEQSLCCSVTCLLQGGAHQCYGEKAGSSVEVQDGHQLHANGPVLKSACLMPETAASTAMPAYSSPTILSPEFIDMRRQFPVGPNQTCLSQASPIEGVSYPTLPAVPGSTLVINYPAASPYYLTAADGLQPPSRYPVEQIPVPPPLNVSEIPDAQGDAQPCNVHKMNTSSEFSEEGLLDCGIPRGPLLPVPDSKTYEDSSFESQFAAQDAGSLPTTIIYNSSLLPQSGLRCQSQAFGSDARYPRPLEASDAPVAAVRFSSPQTTNRAPTPPGGGEELCRPGHLGQDAGCSPSRLAPLTCTRDRFRNVRNLPSSARHCYIKEEEAAEPVCSVDASSAEESSNKVILNGIFTAATHPSDKSSSRKSLVSENLKSRVSGNPRSEVSCHGAPYSGHVDPRISYSQNSAQFLLNGPNNVDQLPSGSTTKHTGCASFVANNAMVFSSTTTFANSTCHPSVKNSVSTISAVVDIRTPPSVVSSYDTESARHFKSCRQPESERETQASGKISKPGRSKSHVLAVSSVCPPEHCDNADNRQRGDTGRHGELFKADALYLPEPLSPRPNGLTTVASVALVAPVAGVVSPSLTCSHTTGQTLPDINCPFKGSISFGDININSFDDADFVDSSSNNNLCLVPNSLVQSSEVLERLETSSKPGDVTFGDEVDSHKCNSVCDSLKSIHKVTPNHDAYRTSGENRCLVTQNSSLSNLANAHELPAGSISTRYNKRLESRKAENQDQYSYEVSSSDGLLSNADVHNCSLTNPALGLPLVPASSLAAQSVSTDPGSCYPVGYVVSRDQQQGLAFLGEPHFTAPGLSCSCAVATTSLDTVSISSPRHIVSVSPSTPPPLPPPGHSGVPRAPDNVPVYPPPNVMVLTNNAGKSMQPLLQPPPYLPYQHVALPQQQYMLPPHHAPTRPQHYPHTLLLGGPVLQQQQPPHRHGSFGYGSAGGYHHSSSSSSTCSNRSTASHHKQRQTRKLSASAACDRSVAVVPSAGGGPMSRPRGPPPPAGVRKTVEGSGSSDTGSDSSQLSSPPQTPSPDQDSKPTGRREENWSDKGAHGRVGGRGGDSTPPLPLPLMYPPYSGHMRPQRLFSQPPMNIVYQSPGLMRPPYAVAPPQRLPGEKMSRESTPGLVHLPPLPSNELEASQPSVPVSSTTGHYSMPPSNYPLLMNTAVLQMQGILPQQGAVSNGFSHLSLPPNMTSPPGIAPLHHEMFIPPYTHPQYPVHQPPLLPTVPNNSNYVMPPRKPLTCFNCGQMGHRGQDCRDPSMEEMTKRNKISHCL